MNASASAIRWVLCLAACIVASGCARFKLPSGEQRARSFDSAARAAGVDEAFARLLSRRTAVLITGDVSVAAAGPVGDGQLAVRFGAEPGRKAYSLSHAVPIDRRGYFLTAAHCLGDARTYLVYRDSGGDMRIAAPRVVAAQDDGDYALLHVGAAVAVAAAPHVFEWADAGKPATGQTVFGVGATILRVTEGGQAYVVPARMGGRVRRLRPADEKGAVLIAHDVPLRFGDSGGPLVAADGRLVGINIGGDVSLTGAVVYESVRPSARWVAEAIDAAGARTHAADATRVPNELGDLGAHLVIAVP
jgi:S1-C subfamily serine protease